MPPSSKQPPASPSPAAASSASLSSSSMSVPSAASSDIVTHSAAETAEAGARLARALRPGAILHLFGDLGAGKTVFVRGLAAGLGLDPDEVSSPTFTLVQEYRGPVTLFHVDLYRLKGAEVGDLELDALAADGILAIEWADRLPEPDARAIIVRIEDAGEDDRRVRIEMPGPPT
jgi:tRNA threonylcarbamoyladenosine biosynthesis protein TsaE